VSNHGSTTNKKHYISLLVCPIDFIILGSDINVDVKASDESGCIAFDIIPSTASCQTSAHNVSWETMAFA
jgi:hypothetical protein